MAMKIVMAPLAFLSLVGIVVYTQSHISCVMMVLAKFVGHVSL